jgi:hypothetical protein
MVRETLECCPMYSKLSVVLVGLAGLASTAEATCYKPSAPSSASDDAIAAYVQAMEEYPRCWHRENILDRIEAGTITFEEKTLLNEELDAIRDDIYQETSEVLAQLRDNPSALTDQAPESEGPDSTPPPNGVDCAELERESTSRLEELRSRLQQSEGLCDSYEGAIELGQIGVKMYSSCPILDPSGEQLQAAQKMIQDGRSGLQATCTR